MGTGPTYDPALENVIILLNVQVCEWRVGHALTLRDFWEPFITRNVNLKPVGRYRYNIINACVQGADFRRYQALTSIGVVRFYENWVDCLDHLIVSLYI
jgi:hypothetical protein